MSYFYIFLFELIRKKNLKLLISLVIIIIPVLIVFLARFSGIDSINSIDRFVMWESFINLVKEFNLEQIILGNNPGIPLRMHDDLLSWFIINQSEKNNALGLHAFNYHSFYLRFFLSYGIVSLFFVLYLLYIQCRKNVVLGYIFMVFILESFFYGDSIFIISCCSFYYFFIWC